MNLTWRSGEAVSEGARIDRLRDLSGKSLRYLARRRPKWIARYVWFTFRRWSAVPGERWIRPDYDSVAELVEKPPGRPVRLRIASGAAIAAYGLDYALWHGEEIEEPDFQRWIPA